MSEKEKRAIEYLENRLDILHNNTQWATEENIKVVLSLIKKQQTEIEELKEENAEQLEAITEWVNGERINDIKHISKDKIREHLKKFEEIEKEFIFIDNKSTAREINKALIEFSKRLLEE